MSDKSHPGWQHVQDHLKQVNSDFVQYESGGALTLELDDEDWQLEITPAGLFVCQAGYALEDMQSLLSDGTAEDLGSDELAKQAKFYIQQVVSKYRDCLVEDGFSERVEMNDEYVAVFFERPIDFNNLSELEQLITRYRRQFAAT